MPQCPICQYEVGEIYNFCPNCGTRLLPASANVPQADSGATVPPGQPKRSRVRVAAAVVIILLLLVVSVFVVIPSVSQARSGSNALTGCPSNPNSTTFVAAPSPNYDLQEVMVFTQSYPQLEFNVTALAQCDATGYGPAYLLNGLSNTGYWYQVGINWNWPLETGGYSPGFGFVSEAWAPGGLRARPRLWPSPEP